MPSSPARLCRDCSKRAVANGYCEDHQKTNRSTEYRKLYDEHRQSTAHRLLYKCKRWINTRAIVRNRDPLCVVCEYKATTVADHYPLSAREIVEQFGVAEFYNPARSRGVCKPCHDHSTATREGFAQRKPV